MSIGSIGNKETICWKIPVSCEKSKFMKNKKT